MEYNSFVWPMIACLIALAGELFATFADNKSNKGWGHVVALAGLLLAVLIFMHQYMHDMAILTRRAN
jgi:drug/metabolite transporter (DMT)-like permease